LQIGYFAVTFATWFPVTGLVFSFFPSAFARDRSCSPPGHRPGRRRKDSYDLTSCSFGAIRCGTFVEPSAEGISRRHACCIPLFCFEWCMYAESCRFLSRHTSYTALVALHRVSLSFVCSHRFVCPHLLRAGRRRIVFPRTLLSKTRLDQPCCGLCRAIIPAALSVSRPLYNSS
jgi:hypothetical protein